MPNTAFIHVIIILVVLWFFKSAKLLGAPRTLGAPRLCPAQLIGCDATGRYGTNGGAWYPLSYGAGNNYYTCHLNICVCRFVDPMVKLLYQAMKSHGC